jgi:uracil-DNA glycosylase family 4
MNKSFDLNCEACPRIHANLTRIKKEYPAYHCRPVPAFGSITASLMIVGLGPGMHGANATGRPFTGDYAGILLYQSLYAYGFANKPEAISSNDGLKLKDCIITNAVKCLPPGNKPTTEEIITCNRFLQDELINNKNTKVILALGKVAHDSVLRAFSYKQSKFKFSHKAEHEIDEDKLLLDSYHCSRYNTQTKRLTEKMFKEVIQRARNIIEGQD